MKRIARDELAVTPRKRVFDCSTFQTSTPGDSSGNEHTTLAFEFGTDESQTEPTTPYEPVAATSQAQRDSHDRPSLPTRLKAGDGAECGLYVCYGMVGIC